MLLYVPVATHGHSPSTPIISKWWRRIHLPDEVTVLTKHQLSRTSRSKLHGRRHLIRLAPARHPKGFCTLNIEDQMVLYALQQRPLNSSLNLEDAAGFSIYRVSLNGPLSI
jgi:hypothetical protein